MLSSCERKLVHWPGSLDRWKWVVGSFKWPMILQHQHHSSADAWNVEQTMKRSQCNTNWWKDGARDLHLMVRRMRALQRSLSSIFNWQNMLERRSKTFNYILRINCRGIRWYVCGQRKPQKPTPMVKSISLSRKNTIQSSENFVGTDWIFHQILSISVAAKHADGWIKGLRSMNEIFHILFGVRVNWNAMEPHGKFHWVQMTGKKVVDNWYWEREKDKVKP